ncbi:MAG: phosphate signaling complex protein PhoU [Xanthomonadaceae bacterium]|jgi:phosphate transport system protein|nr:phosphate signaling complex protein PhoU [Xanthomonadaceae bacterium]
MNVQPHDHIVKSHDEEQQRLIGDIAVMGELVLSQLENALSSVENRDNAQARRVVVADEQVDSMEHRISQDVMRLALRGPMARDLREILAGLRIPTDLERIGDHSADIAKRALVLNQSSPVPLIRNLRALGELAAQQLRDTLEAYRRNDADRAVQARGHDNQIDIQYTRLFQNLVAHMTGEPHDIPPCTHLLFMAKDLERIGDHATNIAESVWFLTHNHAPLPPREKTHDTDA